MANTVSSGRVVVDEVVELEVVDVGSCTCGGIVSVTSSEVQVANKVKIIKDISFFLIGYKNTTILIY